MCAEITQQFCPAVSIIWVAPEDLDGHVQTGPPSVWQIRETTQLQSRTSDVVRGVAYSCELGAAEYTRPVGFLTNVPGLIRELRRGWPVFQHRGPVLRYRGPLPQSCACGSKHTSLEGVATSKALPLFQPAFWQLQVSARCRSLGDGVQSIQSSVRRSLDARQLYEQSLDCLTGVSSRQPQNRVPEAHVNNGSDQLFFHFGTGADCCAWSAPWDWSSSMYGVKDWSASIIHACVLLARSINPISLPLQLTPRVLPPFGEQLTAAMRSLLSVLVEGAWVPMEGSRVERVPRESRASCSGRENQAVAQDEVGRCAECCETTVLGGSEGVQVGWTAAHLQKSGRGGSRLGPERSLKSIGEGQFNSQGCLHPVQHLDIQLGGEVTLDSHHRSGQMNEDSSELPREPHALTILPINHRSMR